MGISFVLIFGSLFSKTYRVYRIFENSRTLKVMKITDIDVLKTVLIFLVVEVAILLLFQLESPLESKVKFKLWNLVSLTIYGSSLSSLSNKRELTKILNFFLYFQMNTSNMSFQLMENIYRTATAQVIIVAHMLC